jgi:hypothetical protein
MLRRGLLVLTVVLSTVACVGTETGGGSGPSDRSDERAPSTTRRVEDPDCDEATIGDDGGTLVAALAVTDGEIDGVCLGEPDARLDAAWQELTAVVPPERLDDVGVVAGFDDPSSDVLAFATMLGESNERFGIAVNLALAEEDPDQFRLTLAHEASHVFSQTPDQLDVAVDPSACPTFHNGNGCFLEGSLLLDWIDRFWTDEQLAALPDPTGTEGDGADDEGAERRCSLDAGFPGVYAASSPEEDFAESFAAYVFGVEVPDEVRPRLDFFAERPELAGFRQMAAADPRGRPAGAFDECGA